MCNLYLFTLRYEYECDDRGDLKLWADCLKYIPISDNQPTSTTASDMQQLRGECKTHSRCNYGSNSLIGMPAGD